MNTQTQTSRIRKIDVGIPPSSTTASDSGWEIIQVHYHNFENLTATRGEAVVSSEFTCFGHTWIASVFPGGMTSCSRDGMVSILLHNLSNKSIKVQYGFSINSESHVSFVSKTIPKEGRVFAAHGTTDVANQIFAACGIFNFCERTKIIENLVDGTLVIEVRMRLVGNLANPSPFIPENPHAKTILKLFNDEESADIVFEVGSDESGRNTRKRAKTTTTFHAHRLILQQCSSTVLNELCKSGGEEAGSRVSITDVKPEVFKHLLYYVYGGKIADEEMEENAKEIIDAADKYGIVGLKLEAEAAFVTSETITFDNAIDTLLYADATNCALLKEAVMDFIYENRKEAVSKLSFDDVPGSVVKDLLTAVNRNVDDGSTSTDANDFSMMRVSTLRKMLDEKGLDVDGSREAMIARLEQSA